MRIIRKIATSEDLQQDYEEISLEERKEASGAQPRTVRGRRNDAGHTRLTQPTNQGRQ